MSNESAATGPTPTPAGPSGHPSPEPVRTGEGTQPTVPTPRRSRVPAAIRAVRPKQWTKNALVFAAPLASGNLLEPAVLGRAALAFVAFCLISGCIYLINDIRDVAEDRLHPKKRLRPIAAGELSTAAAWVLAAICGIASLVIGWFTSPYLLTVLVVYAVLQITYSLFLKHQPVVDLAVVSSGFLLRAIAGGVATGIDLSQWFLLVAAFGSLFMVAGKRYSEFIQLGADAGTRKSLAAYSASYLRFVWLLAAGVTVMSYCLWAFEQTTENPQWLEVPWAVLSIVPLTLGVLQYARDIDSGQAGAPEDVVLKDRSLQVVGVAWVALVAVGVFL